MYVTLKWLIAVSPSKDFSTIKEPMGAKLTTKRHDLQHRSSKRLYTNYNNPDLKICKCADMHIMITKRTNNNSVVIRFNLPASDSSQLR